MLVERRKMGIRMILLPVFASMDCADTILFGFQYLLEYNWVVSIKGEDYNDELSRLEKFSSLLICQTELQAVEKRLREEDSETDDGICCICYTNRADARFSPCSHVSCLQLAYPGTS
ncbi:E3 ubiquitin-protein ligase rkp [Phtheirospermum japonicum]|uniref:E3 ubiquitin-protein ligase rkp n=1 Tax=Phtheirospermum japonicum TaxID=374723 RepID=A0A830C9A4_9LAMI|nr:E3 ubiquitin-protein ligase rkp [Phtheirospermum japonicum]